MMSRLAPLMVVLSVLLPGCEVQRSPVGDAVRNVRSTPAPQAIAQTPSPEIMPATASPAAIPPTPVSSASMAPFEVLKQPRSGTVPLLGRVRLDASYLVSSGAGWVLGGARGGVKLAVAGAGRLIRHQDSSRIVTNAGVVLTADSGNVVVPMLAQGGGHLVAGGGGHLVGNGAGHLVGSGGGHVTASQEKYSLASVDRRLLEESQVAIEQGEILPAAGMRVRVESLLDGRAIPVGEQGDGQPVYEVFTDQSGEFKLFVPENMQANVRVVAEPVESADERLRYDVLISGTGSNVAELNEDSKVILANTHRICHAYITRVLEMRGKLLPDQTARRLVLPDRILMQETALGQAFGNPLLLAKLLIVSVKFAALESEVQFWQRSEAQREAILSDFIDATLAQIDMQAIRPAPELPTGESAWAISLQNHQAIRSRINQRLAQVRADGQDITAYFAGLAFIQRASAQDKTTYVIKKAADFNDFLVRHNAANVWKPQSGKPTMTMDYFEEMGLPYPEELQARAMAANEGYTQVLMAEFGLDSKKLPSSLERFREVVKRHPFTPSPAVSEAPKSTPDGEVTDNTADVIPAPGPSGAI